MGICKSVSTIGCYQQNNNRDYILFSFANATELAFLRGSWYSKGCFHGPPMLSGVYCFVVFVWTREIGLVFLLSIFPASALTK